MSDETTNPEPTSSSVDRRAALKKAALAAGVVAWATPTVQALTPGVAAAQSRVTNCFPNLSFNLILTESNCSGVPGSPPKCCSNLTYFLAIGGGCGASCTTTKGPAATIISAKRGGIVLTERCPGFLDLNNCSSGGSVQAVISATITCGDGVTYTCTYNVNFAIGGTDGKNCDDFLPGTVVGTPACTTSP